jgi:hypothetical protein
LSAILSRVLRSWTVVKSIWPCKRMEGTLSEFQLNHDLFSRYETKLLSACCLFLASPHQGGRTWNVSMPCFGSFGSKRSLSPVTHVVQIVRCLNGRFLQLDNKKATSERLGGIQRRCCQRKGWVRFFEKQRVRRRTE